MIRITLEEAAYEAYTDLGNDILDQLDMEARDIIQRILGIFPYRPHTMFELGRVLGIPRSTAHYRSQIAMKKLKDLHKLHKG